MDNYVPKAWLAYTDSPEQPIYSLDREEQWIGRGEGCHIVIDDRYVSRRQAKIYWKSELLILEDYGHNPVLLNGEPVREVMLKDGDILTIGSSEFIVRVVFERKQFEPMLPEVDVREPATKPPGAASHVETYNETYKENEKTLRESPWRKALLIVLTIILGALLLYGSFMVYKKILVPLRKKHSVTLKKTSSPVSERRIRIAFSIERDLAGVGKVA